MCIYLWNRWSTQEFTWVFRDVLHEKLVIETLRGSVDFTIMGKKPIDTWQPLRNQVTSPGGTSAEALYYLEKAGYSYSDFARPSGQHIKELLNSAGMEMK